jgi:hypothetical protein
MVAGGLVIAYIWTPHSHGDTLRKSLAESTAQLEECQQELEECQDELEGSDDGDEEDGRMKPY